MDRAHSAYLGFPRVRHGIHSNGTAVLLDSILSGHRRGGLRTRSSRILESLVPAGGPRQGRRAILRRHSSLTGPGWAACRSFVTNSLGRLERMALAFDPGRATGYRAGHCDVVLFNGSSTPGQMASTG